MTNSVFSIWKTVFIQRKKTNWFFQNSPIFKSYKDLSLDLSSILFSEHQFYSPDVESEVGWKKLRRPVKYRAVVGGWRRREILLSLSAVFKGWNLTGFSGATLRMSEEGVRKSPWAGCSFGNTHTTSQTWDVLARIVLDLADLCHC